jgi:N-acetylmuramoyl-L-alanine amidase
VFVRCLCIFALLLAGCAAPRKVTPLVREEIPPSPIQVPVQPPIQTPVQPPVQEPAPIVKPPALVSEWVSLADWCASNKFEGPAIKISATETNIELRGERGKFVFEAPRRNARWNGILIGIGFAPQMTNGQVFVNRLDLTKVLEPLMIPEKAPQRKTGGIVVIDAGHGGENFGTLSHDRKMKEKDLTLDWALRVQKLLEGSPWKVILTRPGDIDLALTQRVVFADLKNADLFISLHFNSASDKKVSGLESYCFTPQGMASHLTREYADNKNESYPNNRFDIENLLLAFDLHKSVLKKVKPLDRGIRRARFMTVLREQNRPAVLLEGGYLSNPEEARLIGTPEYRQKLAEAVAEALGVTRPTLTSSRE